MSFVFLKLLIVLFRASVGSLSSNLGVSLIESVAGVT
jgi:hypothetical protein